MSNEPSTWTKEVELPVGLEYETRDETVVVRHVTLRKMTGKEEALLTDPKLKNNAGTLITSLLTSCITELEGIEKVDAKHIRKMASADRNYLLLELRRLTFGDEIDTHYRCPSCSNETFMREDLSEIDIRTLADGENDREVIVELTDGFQGPDKEWYREFGFRLPTGEDEEAASNRKDKNQVRQQDAMLTRCLTRVGDLEMKKIRGMGMRILASLTMSDRRVIQRTLDECAPGPNLLREVCCDTCGHEFKSSLDMRHFFPLG